MSKKKPSVMFQCRECGASAARWQGRCSSCNAWNSMAEVPSGGGPASRAAAGASITMTPLSRLSDQENGALLKTGIADFDRILGGGLPAGAFVLLAGEPGVGKSTLLLELGRSIAGPVYYFSGEESAAQLGLRARRLQLAGDNLMVARETDLELIASAIESDRPALAIIDSVQTLSVVGRDGGAGSAGSLREAAMRLLDAARRSQTPILCSGHITKDGAVAGPRLLEHMVDASVFFESDRTQHFRILRATKNRFGPVGEAAFFEMRAHGLQPVEQLAAVAPGAPAAGRTHSALLEGSRPIAVEVQALVTRCYYGPARRTADGLDSRRLILLAAVLEKTLRLRLSEHDIFANLAGGISSDDPALDLALCAAILSSQREQLLPPGFACFGEVGLSGEVRPGPRAADRIAELSRRGFQRIALPAGGGIDLATPGVDLYTMESVADLAAILSAPAEAR